MKFKKSTSAEQMSLVSPFASVEHVGSKFNDEPVDDRTSAAVDFGCSVEDVGHAYLSAPAESQSEPCAERSVATLAACGHVPDHAFGHESRYVPVQHAFKRQNEVNSVTVSSDSANTASVSSKSARTTSGGKADSAGVLEPLTSDKVITTPQDAARARIQAQALAQIQALVQGDIPSQTFESNAKPQYKAKYESKPQLGHEFDTDSDSNFDAYPASGKSSKAGKYGKTSKNSKTRSSKPRSGKQKSFKSKGWSEPVMPEKTMAAPSQRNWSQNASSAANSSDASYTGYADDVRDADAQDDFKKKLAPSSERSGSSDGASSFGQGFSQGFDQGFSYGSWQGRGAQPAGIKHPGTKSKEKALPKVDDSAPFFVTRSPHLNEPKHGWSAMSNNNSNFTEDEEEVKVVDVPQLREDVNYVFAQDGLFSQKLKNYSPRQGQVDLADTIAQCMGDEKKILMVEAGTGTGKTFSYLVPPILSNCRVVVSTGTKALQDQLVDKDIPNLLRILNRKDFMFMGLKGHSNYLCRNMFENTKEVSFGSHDRMVVERYVEQCLRKLDDYFNHVLNGEAPNFAELRLKLSAEQRHMISCDSTTCQRMRNECSYVRHSPKDQPLEPSDECFITSSRKFAQQCKVITINHALFFASLGISRPDFGDKHESGEMAALEKKVQAGVAQMLSEEQAELAHQASGSFGSAGTEAEGGDAAEAGGSGKGQQFSHLDDLPDGPAPESPGRVMNLLPKPDVLVFDEAHTLPEVGRSFYTRHYNRKQLLDFTNDLRHDIVELCQFVDKQQVDETLHDLELSIKCLDLTFRTLEPRRYSILEFKYVHADKVDYVKLVKDDADALGIEAAQAQAEASQNGQAQGFGFDAVSGGNKSAQSSAGRGAGRWQSKDKQPQELIEFTLKPSGKLAINFKQVSSDKTTGSSLDLGASLKSNQTVVIGVHECAQTHAHSCCDSSWKKDEQQVATTETLEQKLDDIEYFGSKNQNGKGYVNYQLLRQQRTQESIDPESAAQGFASTAHATNGANTNASSGPVTTAPGADFGYNPNQFALPGQLGQYLMGSEQPQDLSHQQGMGQGQPQGHSQGMGQAQVQGQPQGYPQGQAQSMGHGQPQKLSSQGMQQGMAPAEGIPVLQPQTQLYAGTWSAQNSAPQSYYQQRRRQPYHNPQFNSGYGSAHRMGQASGMGQTSRLGQAPNYNTAYPGAGNFGGNHQASSYGQSYFNQQGSEQFSAHSAPQNAPSYGGQMPLFNSFGGRLNGINQAPAHGQSGLGQEQAGMSQGQAGHGDNTRWPGYGNWQAQGNALYAGGAAPFNSQVPTQPQPQSNIQAQRNDQNLGNAQPRGNAQNMAHNKASQGQGGYAQNGHFPQNRAALMSNSGPNTMPGSYMSPQSMDVLGHMGGGQQALWSGKPSWQTPAQSQGQGQGQSCGQAQGQMQLAQSQLSLWDGAPGYGANAHPAQGYDLVEQGVGQPAYQPPYPGMGQSNQGMGHMNQGMPSGPGFNQGAPSQPGQLGMSGQQPSQPGMMGQAGFTPGQTDSMQHAHAVSEVQGGITSPQVFQPHGQQALLQSSHLPPINNRNEGWSGEDSFLKSQHEGVKASNRTASRGGVGAGPSAGRSEGGGQAPVARRALTQPGPNSYLNKDRSLGKFNRGLQEEDVEYLVDENKNPVFNLNFRNVIIRMVKALQKLLSILNHELDKDDFDKDKLIEAQDLAQQIDDMIVFLTDLMTTDRDKYGDPKCEFVAWVMVRDHNRHVEHVSYDEQGDAQDASAKEEEELAKTKRNARSGWGANRSTSQVAEPVENDYEIFLAPIEIGKFLGPELRRLMASGMSIVFASATITTNHDFAKFCYDLGLSQSEVETKIVASPFNYARNARIMYSKDFCGVDDPKRMSKHVAMLKDLIDATPGGVFFLTTSFTALKEAESECRKYFANKRKLYVQGTDSVNNLMAQFREDGKGILIGTSSFWEGVDVPGQALSLVIIDRLPFKQANDPVNKARLDYCAKQGGSPFFQISVPEAIIKLRQGVGRLIRNEKDLGALVILDPRLETKKYGSEFIDSLPPMTRVHSFDEILEFYNFIRDQQLQGLTG